MRRTFLSVASNVCYDNYELEEAERYFNELIDAGGATPSKMLSQIAELLLSKGDITKAEEYYLLAIDSQQNKSDSLAAEWILTQLFASNNDYENAYSHLAELHKILIKGTNRLITHPYTALINDHYRSEVSRQSLLLKTADLKVIIWLSISATLLSVAILLIILFRLKQRKIKEERDNLIRDINSLEIQLTRLSRKQPTSSQTSVTMSLLNRICEARDSMLSGDEGMRRFTKAISEIILSVGDDDNLTAIEDLVNRSYDDLMSRFLTQVPGVTPKERVVSLLLFLGFTNPSIAAILQYRDKSTVRRMRNRIRDKILSNPSVDAEHFLLYF